MTEPKEQLRALLELAGQHGIDVRQEPLGGDGGALCKIKGKYVLFVDDSADAATQVSNAAAALARFNQWDQIYIRPDLRALLEKNLPGSE